MQDKGKLVHSHPANELTEKLFGFESVINKTKSADGDVDAIEISSDAVPTGKIWKITHIAAWNSEADISTAHFFAIGSIDEANRFYRRTGVIAVGVTVNLDVELYLAAEEYITFYGWVVGDGETCYLHIFGYEMNAP